MLSRSWQGNTFDQFWTFFGLILLLTIWQGDTFDQFWTFFGLILLLTIWQGDTFDQFWNFFWTYITLTTWQKFKGIWLLLKLFTVFTKENRNIRFNPWVLKMCHCGFLGIVSNCETHHFANFMYSSFFFSVLLFCQKSQSKFAVCTKYLWSLRFKWRIFSQTSSEGIGKK